MEKIAGLERYDVIQGGKGSGRQGSSLIPVKLCDELNALYAKFWRSQVGSEEKIHWKSWNSLAQPKKEGGMGF